MLAIISDLYEEPEAVAEAIAPLRFRGNDVMVFHVLDSAEVEFSFTDASSFEDIETGVQIPVVPDALRKEYQSLVRAHIDALSRRFSETRVDYTFLDTSKPLDYALFTYLTTRERMMRTR